MPISSLLNFLGLTQKHQHFISERKCEFIQLSTDYENLIRQAHEVIVSTKLMFDTYLAHSNLNTVEIEEVLNQHIENTQCSFKNTKVE